MLLFTFTLIYFEAKLIFDLILVWTESILQTRPLGDSSPSLYQLPLIVDSPYIYYS